MLLRSYSKNRNRKFQIQGGYAPPWICQGVANVPPPLPVSTPDDESRTKERTYDDSRTKERNYDESRTKERNYDDSRTKERNYDESRTKERWKEFSLYQQYPEEDLNLDQ